MLNLISSPGGCGSVSVCVLTISTDRLKYPDASRFADEVGQRRSATCSGRRSRSSVAGLLQLGEPQHRRQRAADLIEHVHRAGLALAQLLDQHDALLQLRLALLELLDLLDHRVQPRASPAARAAISVSSSRRLAG